MDRKDEERDETTDDAACQLLDDRDMPEQVVMRPTSNACDEVYVHMIVDDHNAEAPLCLDLPVQAALYDVS